MSTLVDGLSRMADASGMPVWLLVLGFAGQILFFCRFLVQWVVSERRGESVIPLAFWYFSVAGGATLLSYALLRRDPVFILGQSMGLLIYLRNLVLIRRSERRSVTAEPSATDDC